MVSRRILDPFQKLDRKDLCIGMLLFVATLMLLLATMDMGFTRDESFYFHAAYTYIGWFEDLVKHWSLGGLQESFTRTNMDKHWSYNPEHPVLMKTLFALSAKLFHEHLGWMSNHVAMRLPTVVFSAWLVAMVYVFTRQLFGRAAGLIAACVLLFQPRFFFHAHLACFDAPIVAVWFAVVYAYWRSLQERRWVWYSGVLWGVALATKLNAFFIPVVLVAHWLISNWRGLGVERRHGRWGVRVPRMPWAFVAMLVLGPLVFYMHWPRLWFETFERVRWYMNFHLTHEHYFVLYFGQDFYKPPFPRTFPWVMTLVTVPTVVLWTAAIGVFAYLEESCMWSRVGAWMKGLRDRSMRPGIPEDERGTGWLLLLNAIFPLILIGSPKTPIFGGTKHWMTAMPYWSMIAALGTVWSAKKLAEVVTSRIELRHGQEKTKTASLDKITSSWRVEGLCLLLLGVLVCLPAISETVHNHPFGTSYHNELVGSYRGGADRDSMRQFWGHASRQGLVWLNTHAPKNARVWTHNTTVWAWNDYKKDGLVRKDLRAVGLGSSQFALYHHQRSFLYNLVDLWQEYGTKTPVHVVSVDGVPLLSIYRRSVRKSSFKRQNTDAL